MKAKVKRRPVSKSNGWPAEEVHRRRVADLVPYAHNARVHSPRQVAQIAASIEEWGWTTPVLVDEEDGIIAGHGRVLAALKLGVDEVPCVVARGWTKAQKHAYVIADNQLTISAGWDTDLLKVEVGELNTLDDFDVDLLGFDASTLASLLEPDVVDPKGLEGADEFTSVEEVAVTRSGDLWLLDNHRVLCGDATTAAHVSKLMGEELADLVHADPPYGMGKEADGIANDNLYADKLDAFQLKWLQLALRYARQNCGLYIWGNAPDLWRLWYAAGLSEVDELHVRNEVVWAKGSGFGMSGEGQHSYSPETERCLFLMRGQQFLGNQNKDEYWEGYEPLRRWMVGQRDAAGWKAGDVNRITGTRMAGHWFGKSQFHFITRTNYNKLRAAAKGGAFSIGYDELVDQFSDVKEGSVVYHQELYAQVCEARSYFDNAHDSMTDVWQFGRVVEEDRYGHATPKPTRMIARAVVSSCPEGGLVLEPFLGTGTTLMAAQLFGRRCYGLELEPTYVDVVVRRWQEKTGRTATLDGKGDTTFDEVVHERGVIEDVLG